MTPTKTTTARAATAAPSLPAATASCVSTWVKTMTATKPAMTGTTSTPTPAETPVAAARCGDGVQRTDLQAGEEGYEGCDDGNEANDDACLNTCASARCGDGVRRTDLNAGAQGYERCDDGNEINDDGCADCQLGYGNGSGGDLVLNNARQINTARAAVRGNAGTDQITLSSITGTFQVGQLVMLHQTQSSSGPVGQFEWVRIQALQGSTATTDRQLTHSYRLDGGRKAQAVVVAEYASVDIQNNGRLHAPAWDGTKGGLLAVAVRGPLRVRNGGTIDMNSTGYRGRNHGGRYRCAQGYRGESQLGVPGTGQSPYGMGGGGGGAGQDDASGGGGGHGATGSNGANGGCGACRQACPIPGRARRLSGFGQPALDHLLWRLRRRRRRR